MSSLNNPHNYKMPVFMRVCGTYVRCGDYFIGICPICGQYFEFEEMEGDHVKPWSKGGQTIPENCQMLCKDCNGKKTDKY